MSEHGGVGEIVDSKSQSLNTTEIPKTSSESLNVVQDKFQKFGIGQDGLGLVTAEFPSQSDMESCATCVHIDVP